MKPTKMRNNQIYQATLQTRSKQLGSTLSKDLHKKYGKKSVRVVEGDSITILRGEFKGVEGKVAKISTSKSSIAVEGIKKEKTKGDKFDVYIHTSNLVVTSLNTSDKWRMAKLEGKDPRKQPKETKQVAPKETKQVAPKETKQVAPKETKQVAPKETKQVAPKETKQKAPKETKQKAPKETKGVKKIEKKEDEN